MRKNSLGFQVIKARALDVTPDIATQLLQTNNYEAQRNVKDRHLQELVEEINGGQWRSAEISIAVMPDGKKVLVNGQHTLMACIMADTKVFCFIVRYSVAGPRGLAALYQTFDLGRGARSIGDALKAEMHALGLVWPKRHAALISSASACIETNTFRPGIGKSAQARLIRKYIREGKFILSLCSGKPATYRLLMRAQVIAAIIRSWQAAPKTAKSFWIMVKDEANSNNKAAPSTVLRRYLLDQPETWDRRALYSKCISAFNAYSEGTSIKILPYDPEAPVPVPIKK